MAESDRMRRYEMRTQLKLRALKVKAPRRGYNNSCAPVEAETDVLVARDCVAIVADLHDDARDEAAGEQQRAGARQVQVVLQPEGTGQREEREVGGGDEGGRDEAE